MVDLEGDGGGLCCGVEGGWLRGLLALDLGGGRFQEAGFEWKGVVVCRAGLGEGVGVVLAASGGVRWRRGDVGCFTIFQVFEEVLPYLRVASKAGPVVEAPVSYH